MKNLLKPRIVVRLERFVRITAFTNIVTKVGPDAWSAEVKLLTTEGQSNEQKFYGTDKATALNKAYQYLYWVDKYGEWDVDKARSLHERYLEVQAVRAEEAAIAAMAEAVPNLHMIMKDGFPAGYVPQMDELPDYYYDSYYSKRWWQFWK